MATSITANTTKKITNYEGCEHSINIFLSDTQKKIRVAEHKGTYSVIAWKFYEGIGRLFLCEHDFWGDETSFVILDKDYHLVKDDVWNGFDDYDEELEWEKMFN